MRKSLNKKKDDRGLGKRSSCSELNLSSITKKKLRTKIEDSLEFPSPEPSEPPTCGKPVKQDNIQIDTYEPFFNPHPTLTPEPTFRVEQRIDDRISYYNSHTPPDKPLPVSNMLEKEPSKYLYDTFFCENLFDVINNGLYNTHYAINASEYPYPDYYQRDYDDLIPEAQYFPMAVHTPTESRITKYHMPSDSQPVGLGFTYLDLAFQKKELRPPFRKGIQSKITKNRLRQIFI